MIKRERSVAVACKAERGVQQMGQTLLLAAMLLMALAAAAVAGELKQRFSASDPSSTIAVDHSAWSELLKAYVVPGEDGLNRVDYGRFKKEGAAKLALYLNDLQKVDVSKLNKAEQFAYWANLYNAKTIDIVLQHYPVKSIRDIDISPSLFSNGPWGKKVVRVNGVDLSLDDIEHEIMRTVWRDPRVHYAVNCASVGCPNLMTKAFTGASLEAMLEEGARDYVNSPRGLRVEGGDVTVSKIYRWFKEDFGGSEKGVLAHLRKYTGSELAGRIEGATDIDDYEYDWSLNDTR